jgi:O-antigen/teichoic acid export membrane protein
VPVEQYGVWITISSVLVWLGYFDFGLGTGLKNRLGESIAKGDTESAKRLISTAYFVLAIIMSLVALVFFLLSGFIDAVRIVGNPHDSVISHQIIVNTVNTVVFVFILRFVLQLINPIFDALQMLYSTKIIMVVSQILILITLMVIRNRVEGNILILGLTFSLAPVFALLVFSFVFFLKNRQYAPSLKMVDLKLTKSLYSLGFRFFLVQLNMLVLFQSTNFIIINYIGSSEVVQYNIAFSLFSMMNVGFATIAAPYWSAYTIAWNQKDFAWIRSAQKKLMKIWVVMMLVSLVVLFFSPQIYKLWIGSHVTIDFTLSTLLYVYMGVITFGLIYNTFINSTGKILLQTMVLTVLTIFFIPLVILLINKFEMGLYAIPISLIFVGLYTVVVAPIQSKRLLSGTAKGIFNQ